MIPGGLVLLLLVCAFGALLIGLRARTVEGERLANALAGVILVIAGVAGGAALVGSWI